MQLDTSAEVRKIQRVGRYAQACSGLLFVILAVSGPVTIMLTPPMPAWTRFATVYTGMSAVVAFAIGFTAIGYLYALFGALSKGEIYTLANVRRIRRLGELTLAFGALQIALPIVSLALLNAGIFPSSAVSVIPIAINPESLTLLLTGGLIMLASWIMEIGRRTSEDAEHLRREAELVV